MKQENWKEMIITTDAGIRAILDGTKRIAVIGIKAEPHQPAFYVPNYMKSAGFEIIPVPVYYPDAEEILGEKVYRNLAEIPGKIDLVNIFRRPNDVLKHLDEILANSPKVVWMQSGIRNDLAAEAFAKSGIMVVQDRCLMVEHRTLATAEITENKRNKMI